MRSVEMSTYLMLGKTEIASGVSTVENLVIHTSFPSGTKGNHVDWDLLFAAQ